MTAKQRVVCVYCDTVNPAGGRSCRACGAPLPVFSASPRQRPASPAAARPKSAPTIVRQQEQTETVRKAGEGVDEVVSKAMYAYSLLWRTLAEALTITVVGLALGIVGGATGMQGWGVLGALLVGAAVGWAIKISYLTLLGAPVGLVIGALFGLVLWAAGLEKGVLVFPMMFLALVAALIGGRRVSYARRNMWEKLRPFLGALGGLGFGLLGMLIGWGLQAVAVELLG